MPLTRLQSDILRLHASHRDPESYVAGSTPLTRNKAGLLFLKNGKVVEPDPSRLEECESHAGQRRGQWPTSVEISTAMLERYKRP